MTSAADTTRPVCIVGAAPDTSNLGVSALFASIVDGLNSRLPNVPLVVFDNGLGTRHQTHRVAKNVMVEVEHRGLRMGHRYDRSENLRSMSCLSRLGALGSALNSNIACLRGARAVLDISGGDSFSDIYGAQRFWNVVIPKQIAIRVGVPLVLMPQTYGPYAAPRLRRIASDVVAAANTSWARDARSYEILREMLGAEFSADKHRLGVDMAFGLQAVPIDRNWSEQEQQALFSKSKPLVGLNVSGLVYNTPEASKNFGFRTDYPTLVQSFIQKLFNETDANLLLVPHVMSSLVYESDPVACQRVRSIVPEQHQHRVLVAPTNVDQCEVKWLIGQCDWFCGTRMHATIAALSQGIPTATINYSDKARGVFETCQQGDEVFDPRELASETIVNGLIESFNKRHQLRNSLANAIPAVKTQASEQLDAIVYSFQQSTAR